MAWLKHTVGNALKALFGRLYPNDRESDGKLIAPQIERALGWICVAFLTGFAILIVMARSQPQGGWHLFAIAALAALSALGVGGLLGLLFGLPSAGSRVTIVNTTAPQPPATGTQGVTPATTPMRSPEEDWYRDNTSLEQIAQWLTTAIVALSLANFNHWLVRFDHLAQVVTCSMYAGTDETKSSASKSAATAQTEKLTGATGSNSTSSKQTAKLCADSDGVPGGLILVAYAIFGFLAGYLWSRRYLMGELAGAREDQRRRQLAAQMISERRAADRAEAGRLVQSQRRSAATTETALEAARSATVNLTEGFQRFAAIEPGAVIDDPWKGQFGGKTIGELAEISATITPMTTMPNFYQVNVKIRGVNASAAAQLSNTALEVYLHPTFPDPVRALRFDITGEVNIPLIAYGAFTIGVVLKNGQMLELDLARIPGISEQFRQS